MYTVYTLSQCDTRRDGFSLTNNYGQQVFTIRVPFINVLFKRLTENRIQINKIKLTTFSTIKHIFLLQEKYSFV